PWAFIATLTIVFSNMVAASNLGRLGDWPLCAKPVFFRENGFLKTGASEGRSLRCRPRADVALGPETRFLGRKRVSRDSQRRVMNSVELIRLQRMSSNASWRLPT